MPSPVSNVNVLLAVVQLRSSTPATDAVDARVIRPSSSTVMIGIAVDEP